MPPPIPVGDGEVNEYNLGSASTSTHRVYFVNGMRVLGREHAITAAYLSLLLEHPVWGVYNATAGKKLGSIIDGLQCVFDYTQNAVARVSSHRNLGKPSTVPEGELPEFLDNLEKKYTVWNKATPALFRELAKNRHEQQLIIAHSQGNLITSNALFVMEDVLGSASLQKVRVYSLASPAPAWPLGLRKTNGGGGRQDNAFMNDLVALLRPHNLAHKVGITRFRNQGEFQTHKDFGPAWIGPHDVDINIDTLNLLKSLRVDLKLNHDFTPEFLKQCAKIAAETFPP